MCVFGHDLVSDDSERSMIAHVWTMVMFVFILFCLYVTLWFAMVGTGQYTLEVSCTSESV